MIGLRYAVFMQQTIGNTCAQSVTETIFGWGEFDDNVDFLPQPERDKVDNLADLIVKSFRQFDCPPFRIVKIVGHADKTWHNRGGVPLTQSTAYEDSVSKHRAHAVRDYLRDKTLPSLEKGLPGNIEWMSNWDGSRHLIASPYHRENRRVEVTLIPSGPPIPKPSNDPFSERVRRAAKLIESGKKVDPDSTGTRTKRAYGLLQQLLKPNVNDKAVDGENSNEIINGRRALNERGMPTALCGYPGNWDPPEVTGADFEKFFFHVLPILKGPGWAPTVSDENVLKILGNVVLRIDQGINLTDEYIAHNNSDFGYTGDKTRTKLQSEYIRRMKDENDIYWPFRSKF